MKRIKTIITASVLMIYLTSCGQKSNTEKTQIKPSFTGDITTSHHKVVLEVLNASKNWIGLWLLMQEMP